MFSICGLVELKYVLALYMVLKQKNILNSAAKVVIIFVSYKMKTSFFANF